jgi:hypothetical protein
MEQEGELEEIQQKEAGTGKKDKKEPKWYRGYGSIKGAMERNNQIRNRNTDTGTLL